MTRSAHLFLSLSALATLIVVAPAHAQSSPTLGKPLTPGERVICKSARTCIEIVENHAPDSYDYNVLAGEFARLGAPANAALAKTATDPDMSARVFDIAARPTASPRLRDALASRWPIPNIDAHVALARQQPSPVLRARAISTLNVSNRALRDASLAVLNMQTAPDSPARLPPLPPADADAAFAQLAKSAATAPTVPVIRLLAQVPNDRGAPAIVRALGSTDPDVITAAYLALEALNPARAQSDLRAAFAKAGPDAMPAWTRALEQIGMTSRNFDTIAFGYSLLGNPKTATHHRVVALHSALLYPAGEKGRIRGRITGLLPKLLDLPISDRLAVTVPTHPSFQPPNVLAAFAEKWKDNPETLANFATTIGKAKLAPVAPLLQDMAKSSPDYRTQAAAISALNAVGGQARFVTDFTRTHPIRAVQVLGAGAPRPPRSCLVGGDPLLRAPERLPYFQSGRLADGSTPGRWHLRDAAAIPGGWLAAYSGGLIRYTSDDKAAPIAGIIGEPVTLLPDTVPAPGQRAGLFWILTTASDAARLYRYDVRTGLAAPSTLPPSARIVSDSGERNWAIDFDGDQPTLRLTRDGRLVTGCTPTRADFLPDRLP